VNLNDDSFSFLDSGSLSQSLNFLFTEVVHSVGFIVSLGAGESANIVVPPTPSPSAHFAHTPDFDDGSLPFWDSWSLSPSLNVIKTTDGYSVDIALSSGAEHSENILGSLNSSYSSQFSRTVNLNDDSFSFLDSGSLSQSLNFPYTIDFVSSASAGRSEAIRDSRTHSSSEGLPAISNFNDGSLALWCSASRASPGLFHPSAVDLPSGEAGLVSDSVQPPGVSERSARFGFSWILETSDVFSSTNHMVISFSIVVSRFLLEYEILEVSINCSLTKPGDSSGCFVQSGTFDPLARFSDSRLPPPFGIGSPLLSAPGSDEESGQSRLTAVAAGVGTVIGVTAFSMIAVFWLRKMGNVDSDCVEVSAGMAYEAEMNEADLDWKELDATDGLDRSDGAYPSFLGFDAEEWGSSSWHI
jgi:hypothetical protein